MTTRRRGLVVRWPAYLLCALSVLGGSRLARAQAFQQAFSIQNTSAPTIFTNCGTNPWPAPAGSPPCFPNLNQVGHTITYSWTSSSALCTMLFDGSNDLQTWTTLAASNSGQAAIPLTQTIGTGNGVLVTFSGTLTSLPTPLSVTVTAGAVSGTDNGSGVISGAGIASGTVSYTTGAISVTFSVAPANGVAVVVTYTNRVHTGMIYANGYYTGVRVKLSACQGGTLSAVYTGYYSPLPVTVIADSTFTSSNVKNPVQVTNYGTPFVIKSFQCFNTNSTPAYIQLFKSPTAPTLGANFFYQIGVPAASGLAGTGGSAFSYAQPDIQIDGVCCSVGSSNLWVGAVTTPGGNTAVTTPLVCNFQTNGSGPFYPQTPASP